MQGKKSFVVLWIKVKTKSHLDNVKMETRSVNDGLDYSGDAAAGSFFSSDYKRYF